MGTDASVYLLERTGDFGAVLELLLGDYSKAFDQFHRSLVEAKDQNKTVISRSLKRLVALSAADAHSKDAKPDGPWWEGFEDAQRCINFLDNTYELSSRNSNLMTS